MSSLAKSGILRASLQTAEPDTLRQFYGETLGIPLVMSEDGFALRIGASELEFVRGESPPYHFALNIPSARFAEAKAWLSARVPTLPIPAGGDTMHWRAWNAHACYFRDPAGNIGELIARYNLVDGNELATGQPFGPQHLLGISEIGLALADVSAACRLLEEELDLTVWDAGDGERFRAMGGERGLLICVRAGHAWFPTSDTLAEAAPLTVLFSGEESRQPLAAAKCRHALRLPGTDYVVGVAGD